MNAIINKMSKKEKDKEQYEFLSHFQKVVYTLLNMSCELKIFENKSRLFKCFGIFVAFGGQTWKPFLRNLKNFKIKNI